MQAFFSSGINKTALHELKSSFFRYQSTNNSKNFSLKGRLVCVLLSPVHFCGIGLKPIMYTAITLKNCVKTVFLTLTLLGKNSVEPSYKKAKSERNAAFRASVDSCLCLAASPLGQIAQTCKAALGVFHPSAYFKKPEGSRAEEINGHSETETDSVSGVEVEPQPEIPMQPSNHRFEMVRGEYKYCIDCDIRYPSSLPEEALDNLAQHYLNRPTPFFELKVSYYDQDGYDAGGLRRDYISRLFAALSKKHELHNSIINCEEKNEEDILKQIGIIFGYFVTNLGDQTLSPLPLGEVFHPSYFQGILALTNEEIRGGFHHIAIQRFLQIGQAICKDEELDYFNQFQAFMAWDGDESDSTGKRHIEFIENTVLNEGLDLQEEDDLPENFLADLATHLPKIKRTFRMTFADRFIDRVKTLHTIAKAMNCQEDQWDVFRGLGAENFQQHIQGRFSKEMLQQKITTRCPSDEDVSDIQQSIVDWIGTKTDEELRNFLKFVSGAPSIPVGNVLFDFCRGHSTILVHSCFNQLDLPVPPNSEDERRNYVQYLLNVLNEYCLDIPASFDIM